MKVHEIMTEPPLTCTSETSLAMAARLMGEADYGALPVIDGRGALVGIVTDRDVYLALSRTNRNALNIPVREVMTKEVVSALPDDDVKGALAAMKRARVRRLPVCDQSGRLKGMLSMEDVVVRGLQGNGVSADEIIAALRAIRLPIVVDTNTTGNGFKSG
jgi:CBS domain-containing protein